MRVHPLPLLFGLALLAGPLAAQAPAPSTGTRVAHAARGNDLRLTWSSSPTTRSRDGRQAPGAVRRRQVHRDPVRATRPRAGGRQRHLLPARSDHRAHSPPTLAVAAPTPAADLEERLRHLVHAQRGQRAVGADAVFVGYGIVAPEQGGTTTRDWT